MMRVYCEHGAITSDLRRLQHEGVVELVRFPYDPNSRSRHINTVAVPSAAQLRDLNLTFAELAFAFSDHQGSQHLSDIVRLIGPGNRRDALHIDSAFKSGCGIFVTQDKDILRYRQHLEGLLGIRFFHPDDDKEALLDFIRSQVDKTEP